MLVARTLAPMLALCFLFVSPVGVRAQAPALYFPATGHHLTDTSGFLSFWRERDGERLLGFPVTEELDSEGVIVQYFTGGRLERHVDPHTGVAVVTTGAVGSEYAAALWRRFAPPPPRASTRGALVFEATGHTLREPFLSFWEAAGGIEFFGAPISEAIWEMTEHGQRQVQYFERARLERDPALIGTPDEVVVGNLGLALAQLRGVDTAPVANRGAAPYGPPAPSTADVASLHPPAPPPPPAPAQPAEQAQPAPAPSPQPQPAPAPRRESRKVIVVNLSDQWLYAYEGDTQVFSAPVATGRDGMNTPTGTYAIYAKLKSQTMRGVDNGVPWVVPDVPDVMYFNGGVALHGTYWHNLFGTGARPSHGCVNLPLDSATWLYDWAPIGTTVRVTY